MNHFFLGYAVIQFPDFVLLVFNQIKKQRLRKSTVPAEDIKNSIETQIMDTDFICSKKPKQHEVESTQLAQILNHINVRLDGNDRRLVKLEDASTLDLSTIP